MLVLDASVLVKLFRAEDDSSTARELVRTGITRGTGLLAPNLILYEMLSVALHYEMSFEIPLMLLADMRDAGFMLVEPSVNELLRAQQIATSRHEGRRSPGLEDSIYHAIAIERGGTFVTADSRHVERTAHFGHVTLLADWQPG